MRLVPSALSLLCVSGVSIVAVATSLVPDDAGAASLSAIVEQGGDVVSDPSGNALVAAGTDVTVSIFLVLDPGELASVFEGVFDLTSSGFLETALLTNVEGEWASVAENTSGSQSTWSDLSEPSAGTDGMRLVAQWDVDGSLASAGDPFEVAVGAGTFAGTDLNVDPFFELIDISNPVGETLASVVAVPEPGTTALVALGLVGVGIARSHRR